MSSDGAQLRAAGAKIVLADGVERRLVLDLDALLAIEERCGSLLQYLEGFTGGWRGKRLKTLTAGVCAGLAHDARLSEADVKRLLSSKIGDWAALQSYVDALDAAWEEAWPKSSEASASGKDSSPANASPGGASTTSPPSASDEGTWSSGA